MTEPAKIGAVPWLAKSAIEFLGTILRPEWRVLETGAGGSTIWLAERCREVITYEHSRTWAQAVNGELQRRGLKNAEVRFAPAYPHDGLPADLGEFDFVLIDGRGRVKSIETAQVKSGGWLMLDNYERPRYGTAIELLKKRGWPCRRFDEWIHTAIWQRC